MTLMGQRIKELRKKNHLTQKELGDRLNVTKVSVCCYEKGTRTPSLETLVDLSNIFKVNLDYFLGNDNYVVSDTNDSYGMTMAKEEIDFITELRKYTSLHERLLEDPKRTMELIDKKLR